MEAVSDRYIVAITVYCTVNNYAIPQPKIVTFVVNTASPLLASRLAVSSDFANMTAPALDQSPAHAVRTDRKYSLPALQAEVKKYLKAERMGQERAGKAVGVSRVHFNRALNDETGEPKYFLLLERFAEEQMGYRLQRTVTFKAERIGEPK